MKKNKILFLLLFILLLPLFSFLHSGLPLTHDGQDHVARMANFCASLKEGNLVPRWAANLNWGYGHPILMFLYPLPSFAACFFNFLGFGLVEATKISFALSFLLSGWLMFLWAKESWGKKAGLAAALVYLFAPYRFVDLYVRGAIGECWAFVWPPLILYFALKLSRKFQYCYLIGGALAWAALFLSHNALSLMFLPLIIVYLGYLVFTSPKKWRLAVGYLFLVATGFALSAFFWLPAFFEGKYTLRDIVTKGNITGFETFSRLIHSSWNYGGSGSFSVQLGIIQWLGIILSPWLIWQLKRKNNSCWIWYLFLFVYFWIGIFLILPFSRPLYLKISLLQKFQFAWRWLSLAIFIPPLFWAGFTELLSSKKQKKLILGLTFALPLLTFSYWQPKGYLLKPESFYTQAYPGTTDTGESAPRWSVRFMEKYPSAPIEVIDGKARVQQLSRQTTEHQFLVESETEARLVDNTLYFPGWQVFADEQPVEIQFQDPNWRGLITFRVAPGAHRVKVIFRETRLRRAANSVSGLAVLGLLFIPLMLKLKRQ
jgi:hypothetical protein